VCIVNNNFTELSRRDDFYRRDVKIERKGSQKDIEKIKTTFRNFNFQISDEVKNRNKETILKKIATTKFKTSKNGG